MPTDYRALIQDRKQKQTRPIVRHAICLAPELYADLEEAAEELRHFTVESIGEDDEDAPPRDRRGGGLSAAKAGMEAARVRVAEAEAKIAEVSVLGVFKAPSGVKQAESHDSIRKAQEEDPERVNQIVLEHAKVSVLEAFDRFEVGGERIDLGRDDLAAVLDEWSHGEIVGLANKLQSASVGAPDLPFSVQQSLLNRPSGRTSKQP